MVTIRAILRGAGTRFLPTAAVGALAILVAFDGRAVAAIEPSGWALLGGLLVAETVGFATLLTRLRYRLGADADVDGRRSVVAGALGIVGLFVGSILSQGAGVPWALLLAASAGAAAGGITYWPWIRSQVGTRELEAWEAVDLNALGVPQAHSHPMPATPTERVRVHDRDA